MEKQYTKLVPFCTDIYPMGRPTDPVMKIEFTISLSAIPNEQPQIKGVAHVFIIEQVNHNMDHDIVVSSAKGLKHLGKPTRVELQCAIIESQFTYDYKNREIDRAYANAEGVIEVIEQTLKEFSSQF